MTDATSAASVLGEQFPWLAASATTVNHHPAVPFVSDSGSDGSSSELNRLTSELVKKFEELTMIHQFTEQLRIDADRVSICRELIEPLMHCINAVTLAIELYPDLDVSVDSALIQVGQHRDDIWLKTMADSAMVVRGETLAIINQPLVQGDPTKRILVVPIARGARRIGRMIAVGDNAAEEFGTVEADLMRSTGMMLAVHLVNQRQFVELKQTLDGVLVALVSAIDAKDHYTCGHSSRVSELSVALAQDLGLKDTECEILRKSALLHDIGKIGVDDAVLRKHGELSKEEYHLIKQHPVIGYNILKTIGPFEAMLPGVLHHHESWDGKGYPHGLAGDDIPRLAQIIAVADSFDAMTSDRPYRPGMSLDRVLTIFKRGMGVQWAPDVALVLVTQIEALSSSIQRTPM